MANNPVTIGYWAIRGLGERIRNLAEYLHVPYVNESFEGPEGRQRWVEVRKPELIQRNAAITLPFLIDGDRVVSESDAILVYLCHRGNREDLLGRNLDERVNLATALGVLKDFHPNYVRLVYGSYNAENTFQKAREASYAQFAPYLAKLRGIRGQNEFIAGGLTWIDFAIAEFLQVLQLLSPEYLKNFQDLADYQKKVWSLPGLKEYIASDRFRERPCNNYIAAWV